MSTPGYSGGAAPSALPRYQQIAENPTVAEQWPAGTGSGEVTTRPCLLMGWSVRESSGSAAAVIRLRNGHTTDGAIAASIGLATSGSTTDTAGPDGVWCDSGLYLEVVSGAVEASIWVKV